MLPKRESALRSKAFRMENIRTVTFRIVLAAALTGLGCAAIAQDEPARTSLAIEEIVVSAQRRLKNLEDVPVVVSVLNSGLIQDSGIVGLADIQNYVPSLLMERNTHPYATTIRIRGVGNLGNIPNFEPAVGLFIDGAFRSRTGFGMGDLADVDRIEVLHGPQSTLYGKNVSAGVVSIVTKRPTDTFEGSLEGSAGSDNEYALKASVSGPMGDTVRGRLSAHARSRDGLAYDLNRQDDINEVKQWSMRGQLLFEPSDRLSIRTILGYSDKGTNLKCCAPDTLYGPVSSAFVAGVTGEPVADNDPTNRIIEHNDTYRFEGDTSEATLRVEYNLDAATLISLTSFDTYKFSASLDAEQSVLDIWRFDDRQEGDTLSQELRLTSTGGGSVEWMAGVYYYDKDFTRGSLDPSEPILELGQHIVPVPLPGTPGDSAYFLGETKTRNFSVFGQGTWHLTNRFSLAGGLRWFDEEKRFSVNSSTNLAAFPSQALAITVPAPQSGKRDSENVAWNLSAQFSATDDLMTYASVSRGVKGGGFNADWGTLTLQQREFDDEEVLSYELGVKSSFLDRRWTLNMTLFHSQYDNFQNASFLGVIFLVRNAEEMTSKGLELESSAVLAEWLQLDVSATFLDADYDQFSSGPCFFGRTPDNPADGTCMLDGERLPSAPDLRIRLGGLGHWSVNGGELYARADGIWTDEVQTNTNLDPRSLQPSYAILNGRIGWRNEQIDLSAWIQNATDENVALVSGAQALFGGTDGGLQFFLNDPRRVGMTLRYRF